MSYQVDEVLRSSRIDPLQVTQQQVDRALTLLGIRDYGSIMEVRLDAHAITVERFRRSDVGQPMVAGNTVATVRTEIPIDRERS